LDKFCPNCKKVKQASRMGRFIPEMEKFKEYGLYHLTLTVPNVGGHQLNNTIKTMFKALSMLIKYLNGTERIKGLDFNKWGFKGAIRSLEVTFKKDSYHPHLHVAIAMNLRQSKKVIENQFSFDNSGRKSKRLFTKQEELIQKIWYLLINKQKVTVPNLSELASGYSCTLEKFQDENYQELFKYLTKNDSGTMSYDNFKILYEHLLSVRQIQGYGVFFHIKDDDSIVDQVDEYYNALLEHLQKEENPERVSETPQDLANDNEYLLISRKKIFQFLTKL